MRSPRSIFFDLDGTLLDGSGLRESIARTCASIASGRRGLDAVGLVAANGDAWQSYWPEVEASWMLGRMDGAAVSLEVWRRARVPLALITNGASDTQRDKIRVLEIERWFDAVVISAEAGVAKPDAAVFARALDALAVDREHVWHVGDSLSADVGGAKAAGISAVWLNRNGRARRDGDPEPDVEIRSLAELAPLLAE